MKKITLTLAVILFITSSYSQTETKKKLNAEKTITTNHTKKAKPEYYLNDEIVDFEKIYLNNNNIKNINVTKKRNGQIFIQLKDNVTLENLSNLKHKNINSLKNKVFIIDNKIIKKPTEIKIDKTEIATIEIISNSEFENQNSKFTIIKITTKSAIKQAKNKNQIFLRGQKITVNK